MNQLGMKATNMDVVLPQRGRSGPKPGNPHSGQFKKGYDPRRDLNGWSNMHRQRSIEDKFQAHTDKAYKVPSCKMICHPYKIT